MWHDKACVSSLQLITALFVRILGDLNRGRWDPFMSQACNYLVLFVRILSDLN